MFRNSVIKDEAALFLKTIVPCSQLKYLYGEMNWIDAKVTLPRHREEVYLKYDGTVGLATFDSEKGKFLLPNGAQISVQHSVFWSAIELANKSTANKI